MLPKHKEALYHSGYMHAAAILLQHTIALLKNRLKDVLNLTF